MNPDERLLAEHSNIPELSEEQKRILDERLKEDTSTYMSAKAFLEQLKKKYGL